MRDAIAFGEKVLAMLDQGLFTATYKYAVLLALVDACLEHTDADGTPPTAVHPRTLGQRVVELYWPHTSLYGGADAAVVLRQNRGGQAEIVTLVRRFRETVDGSGHASLATARLIDASGYERLVDDVTWKLVQMPLPRLQRFGQADERFLYDLEWDEQISRGRFERREVDPLLRLHPGVGDHLVRLAGLLRPLVQQQWASHVVALNRRQLPALDQQDDLDGFLFGATRIDLSPVRADLRELQDGDCFYCHDRLRDAADVDHFLPWSRHPDDGIHNLVVAHARCNNRKRNFLAAATHVDAWARRFSDPRMTGTLEEIAAARRWSLQPSRTMSVARAVYLRLPDDARLWLSGDEFVEPEHAVLAAALGVAPTLPAAAEDSAAFEARHDP